MKAMTKQGIRFPDLHKISMNSISQWAGHKITERGVQYQQDKMVKDICITAQGFIVADVDGSKRYSVVVSRDEAGLLQSFCSCPYAIDCKHGVAALLEYISRVEKNENIPQIPATDPRVQLLQGANNSFEKEKATKTSTHTQGSLQKYLSSLTKQQLIEKICTLVQDTPKIRTFFQQEQQNSQKNESQLLKILHKEIEEVTNAHHYLDPWEEEDSPDYSQVRNVLRTFLDRGMYDAILAEAPNFLQQSMEQLDNIHDEGEIAEDIASCLALYLVALQKSSWTLGQKLIWALDMVFLSEFNIYDGYEDFLREKFPISAWDDALVYLQAKLQEMSTEKMEYARDEVARWYVYALEQAARDEEVLLFCEKEAQMTHEYERLVRYLLQKERFAEALHWIDRAYNDPKARTSTYVLHRYCREIYTKQKNWNALLLLDIQSFLESSSLSFYERCQETASNTSFWTSLREVLLDYLVQGILPWKHTKWPQQLEVPHTTKKFSHSSFPNVYILIQIAIVEKDAAMVYHWYSQIPKGTTYGTEFYDAIAYALKKDYPEVAIYLWQQLAQNTIAQTNKSAYAMAVGYLRQARACMLSQNLEQDWESFFLSLKKQHARKKNFISLLATLDETPLLPES